MKKNKWPFPQESEMCSDKRTSWRDDKASTDCKVGGEGDGVFCRPSKEKEVSCDDLGLKPCSLNTKLL